MAQEQSWRQGCAGYGLISPGEIVVKILLVEDEVRIAELIVQGFETAGHQVSHSLDGESAIERLAADRYDILILDLMLPGIDGIDVLRQVRAAKLETAVIILSAKAELGHRLEGFELGADDYVPKPFYLEELVARAQVVAARRSYSPANSKAIQVGGLTLDLLTRSVHWDTGSAVLTPRELHLLVMFMRSPGHIFSRQQILREVWNIAFDPNTNVVDVCLQRLKRKIDFVSLPEGIVIESIRGVGYRLRLRLADE